MAQNKDNKTKVEGTEEIKVQEATTEDKGTKVETKDVLPENLTTELKGESKGPEFKVVNAKSETIEKAKTVKIIRN